IPPPAPALGRFAPFRIALSEAKRLTVNSAKGWRRYIKIQDSRLQKKKAIGPARLGNWLRVCLTRLGFVPRLI
ncbi:MAG TPA: hypothetical protein VFZ08_12775, partial [Terriglobia bacterium]|nr:hypothetical protein [Terriglobia bacterium]